MFLIYFIASFLRCFSRLLAVFVTRASATISAASPSTSTSSTKQNLLCALCQQQYHPTAPKAAVGIVSHRTAWQRVVLLALSSSSLKSAKAPAL